MKSEIFTIPQDFVYRNYYNDKDKYLPLFRTPFMRDRDRIMYSTAFRRLAGKTQIYTIGPDDHRKNRLTHSLEVSDVARTIAQALDLKTDLTEAIALAHDLGHTPFGHAGEEMLNSIMTPNSNYISGSPYFQKTEGQIQDELDVLPNSYTDICNSDRMFGFKHNIQSLRVACVIEDSYRGSNGINIGLNLTNYTLWGMLNHSKVKYNVGDRYPNYQNQFERFINLPGQNARAWSLEGYIVRISDDIAQWHHDLEDALRGNAIPLADICKTISDAFGNEISDDDKESIKDIKSNLIADRKTVTELAHIVVNTLVNNVCKTSEDNLKKIYEILKNDYKNKSDAEIAKMFYSHYEELND